MSCPVLREGRQPLAEPDAVASHLGVTVKTLTQWRWRKTGPRWLKVGGAVRYRWEDIEKWLEDQAAGDAS